MNLSAGHTQFTTLSTLDLTLVQKNSEFWLRNLDFLNIQALTPARTGLPGETKYAWELRASIEAENRACWNCSLFSIQAGIGKSFSLGKKLAIYGMLDGRLQSSDRYHSHSATETAFGITGEAFSGCLINLLFGRRYFLDGNSQDKNIVKIESRFLSNSTWDVRLSYTKDVASETRLSIGYKF